MKQHIKSSVETITPLIAAQILEHSKEKEQIQRNVNQSTVLLYASEMTKGNWKLNGEALILDIDSVCIEGQHRLLAIINSGVAIDTLVTRGVDNDSFETIDTGMSRSAGHILQIAGYSGANDLASIIRGVICFERSGVNRSGLACVTGSGVPPHEILEYVRENPSIEDFLRDHNTGDFRALYRTKTVYRGLIYALLYILWREVPEDVVEFMRGVSLCENMPSTDPRMVLSNTIAALQRKEKEYKVTRATTLSLYVQAWNAYIKKSSRKTLNKKIDIPNVVYAPVWLGVDDE